MSNKAHASFDCHPYHKLIYALVGFAEKDAL